jgi:hypothetical protein
MKLIHMIPVELLRTSLEALSMDFPQFTMVLSQGYLKIYKQVVA